MDGLMKVIEVAELVALIDYLKGVEFLEVIEVF